VFCFVEPATGASKNETGSVKGAKTERDKAPKEDGTGKRLTFPFPTIKQQISM